MAKIEIEESEERVSSPERHVKLVVKVFFLVLCFFIGTTGYFFFQYQKALRNPDTSQERSRLVERLSAVMELPESETPTLATVTGQEKLIDELFLEQAESGDKVLLYTEARRALLYRPSTGKIVDIMVIENEESDEIIPTETHGESDAPAAAAPIPEESTEGPIKVVLLNGSTRVGVTQGAEEKLLSAFPEGFVIVAKEKAAQNTYQGMLVVDMSGKSATKVAEVATTLGGAVGPLPASETRLEGVDMVILIGNADADTGLVTEASPWENLEAIGSTDVTPEAAGGSATLQP